MDVLSMKFKQHREEISHALTVSTELLTLLTREGLLDIADCVKYQGITNTKRRTAALMKTLTERRTDRAYNILLQCLRETGQHKAVDLLTDVGEEAQAIQELQLKLDEQVKAIDEFLEGEEKRARIEPDKLECGHDRKARIQPPATNDRQVWIDAQDSMRRAVDSLARCKAVISKLHKDCLHVAQTNAALMTETRNCYLENREIKLDQLDEKWSDLLEEHSAGKLDSHSSTQVTTIPREYRALCGMVRPSTKSASELQTATTTTQELFRLLVSDVNRLMVQRSKMAEHEQQGRTSAMRVLRKLRDWIVDRCTVLNTLHSAAPTAPFGNSRFLQRRGRLEVQPIVHTEGNYIATYKSLPDYISTSDEISIQGDSHGKKQQKPMLLDIIPSSQSPGDDVNHHDFLKIPLLHEYNALVPLAPVASSTPQPHVINAQTEISRQPGFNTQPISSVVEGVHQLEGQLREYIHLEIILTDRFRQELRRRQQQKKSLGLSSRGVADAQSTLLRLLSSSENNKRDDLASLRSQIDQISIEYSECCQYVDKAVRSLTQIEDVESFLRNVQEREQAYRKNKAKCDNKKDSSNQKIKTSRKDLKALKGEQEAYDALVELFRKESKIKDKQKRKSLVSQSNVDSPRSKAACTDTRAPTDNFVSRLKLLVANYEIIRLRMLTLEDRFRREDARRERDTKSIIQGRDEEIFRLQTLLRESEAEKDKYYRLYEHTKIANRKR